MKLFTRCPHCETAFRVTPPQLQSSGGQVRCGRCDRVFDAFSSLSSKQPELKEKSASAAEPALASHAPDSAPEEGVQNAPDIPARAEGAPEILAPAKGAPDIVAPAKAAPNILAPAAEQPIQESTPATRPPAQAASVVATPPSIDTNLYEWEFRPAKEERLRWPFVIGSLFALVALTAQAAIAFRNQLTLAYPETRVWFMRACDRLQCSLPLPRLDDKLNIESSGLEAVDSAQPSQILLTAALRNRAGVSVAYPALELTLTDDRGQAIARRVFLPREYLERALDLNRGFDAGTEINLRLYLDTADLRTAGYRLYLFYP